MPPTLSIPPTQCKPSALRQLGARRLTRAHLALKRRNGFTQQAKDFGAKVSAALAQELGSPFALEAHLIEARSIPANELADVAAFAVFDLGATASHAVLELELPFVVAALASLGAREVCPAGPVLRLTRIEEATLGYLLLSALNAASGDSFSALLRPRLRRVTLERSAALAPLPLRQPHLGMDLRFSLGELRGAGRLYLPASPMRPLIDAAPMDAAEPLEPELGDVPMQLTCHLAPVTLTRAEAARLRVGDAVVLENASLSEGCLSAPARLRSPLFLLEGVLSPSGFTFQRARTRASPQESAMKSFPDRTEVTPQLPIEVEVVLTRFRLSLAELATLKPGALLALQITAQEPVTLRIGERTIARAELVDIEGEVAARILSLSR